MGPVVGASVASGLTERLGWALRRAREIRRPMSLDPRLGIAIELHKVGRVAEAEKLYRDLLQYSPRDANLLYLLGLTALATNQYRRAADLLSRSIRINSHFVPAHLNLGLALVALNRPKEALARYDEAIARDPDLPDSYCNRGILLKDIGQPQAALASFDQALALRPDDPDTLNNRGLALDALKRHGEALETFDRALSLRRNFPEASANRGNTLNWLHRPDEALESFDQALKLRPDLAEAWCNRGDTLHEKGRFPEALASFDKALELKRNFAEAHYGRSLTLLMLGRYAKGFREYEWRKQRSGANRKRTFSQPLWLGESSLSGRTLYIYPELFLGDMIQFCRYAVLAAARNAKVILAVPRPLVALLCDLGPGITVIEEAQPPGKFDFNCPLLSLPLAFATTLDAVPAEIPYLQADPTRVEEWRNTIGPEGLKIGICWQGSANRTDLDRSFPLTAFAPLASMPSVRLISLQTGFGVEQLAGLPVVEHFDKASDAEHRPFVETAAMMMNLDLVITTDTSIAHLAGALGRPTWIALRHVPDWRWGADEDTTPWYPTVRLFRQKAKSDWDGVFSDILRAVQIRSSVPPAPPRGNPDPNMPDPNMQDPNMQAAEIQPPS
jgi:tetratricopeptide (TPR) repeat protein